MKMKNLLNNLNEFALSDSDFQHPSYLHGRLHTYRVIAWTVIICNITDYKKGRNAFFAAMVHDMGRVDDSKDPLHGLNSARKYLPKYKGLFRKYGASETDLDEIAEAITMHSLYEEKNDNETLKILKDADALDRVRLHPHKPDPTFLRYSFTWSLVPAAAELLKFTEGHSKAGLQDIIHKAADLAKVKLF
ncbi:MAG: hypothetical protein C0592_07865 [Marinilabiliales bacterium]|nr:MAG: hypothetical protein C0592_07865 [Marinilabiliales bacterium]